VIVDDHEAFLAAASRRLAFQGMDVLGGASSTAEEVSLVVALLPDVAVVDVHPGEEDGLALAARLASAAIPSR
jgi:DNA-binding NarL/FixJ family response regulator